MVLVSAFKTYHFGMDNSSSRTDRTKLTQQSPRSLRLGSWKAWFMPNCCKKQSALQELPCSAEARHF